MQGLQLLKWYLGDFLFSYKQQPVNKEQICAESAPSSQGGLAPLQGWGLRLQQTVHIQADLHGRAAPQSSATERG